MTSEFDKDEISRKILEGLAGANARDMLSSPESAVRWLTHADRNVRIAALSVLRHRFPQWEELPKECERILASDADPLVRLRAKLCLADLFQRRRDPRARRILAEITRDDSVSKDVRMSCYVLLLAVLGIRSEGEPKRFPSDIQWAIVDNELQEGQP